MKTPIQISLIPLALLAVAISAVQPSTALAQGTAFTYQGQLLINGNPANGLYDFRAGLYTASTGGTVFAGPIINSGVAVSNGIFLVTLDYGNVFDGTAYWLQVAVETNGGSAFTVLSPRQQLTPTPYAVFAEGANAAGLMGTLPSATLAGPYSGVINLTNQANVFAGNGGGLSGVNATTLGGLSSSNFWTTTGNAGTSPTNGNFVGTTDTNVLELHVNGARAFRLEPIPNASNLSNMVNVVGGSSVNFVSPGNVGATIAGGGSSLYIISSALTNSVSGDFGSIGGGGGNTVESSFGTVAGGRDNFAGGFNVSTIGGGENNNAGGPYATIGGGYGNNATGTLFGGYDTIAGGEGNTADGDWATVSGGSANTASGEYAEVGGGSGNNAGGNYATIGGGSINVASSLDATVAGGISNLVSGDYGTAGGGASNSVFAAYGTVAGGTGNTALGNSSTVGGGNANFANFANATVGGGIENYAVAPSAVVCGGNGNQARGTESMSLGGYANDAEGNRSFAAGSYAWAEYDGSFVWADDSVDELYISTTNNVFFARCTGGVKFTTATDAGGHDTAGVKVAAGGTSWSAVCDRNAKKNFAPLDTVALLNKLASIPIEKWNYKWEADTDTPNIGPMAQDFKAAFYPGRDDKSISTLEFDGVALAAIQGLNQKVEAENAELRGENAELKRQNEAMEQKLAALQNLVQTALKRP